MPTTMHFARLYLLICVLMNVSARKNIFKRLYHEHLLQAMVGCIPRFKVDTKDLSDLLGGYDPEQPATKCLLSCAYKKVGTLTTMGYYNTYNLIEEAYAFKHDKEKNLTDFEKEFLTEDAVAMGDQCWKVNLVNVTDRSRGCQRAAILVQCLNHNNNKVLDRDFKLWYIFAVEKAKLMCLHESNSMSDDVISELQDHHNDSNCLLACAYKYEGTMTTKGDYDPKHIVHVANEFLKHNFVAHERSLILRHAHSMSQRCEKVNEVKVKDQDKGCERAALILNCRIEHANKEFGDY